jgi:hypothetical protein
MEFFLYLVDYLYFTESFVISNNLSIYFAHSFSIKYTMRNTSMKTLWYVHDN